MTNTATSKVSVTKINEGDATVQEDFLAAEEPLEIRMITGAPGNRIKKSISVTMRTPGNDVELALGFLFTEGIIRSMDEVKQYDEAEENVIEISLAENAIPDFQKLERNFYTTSSCGVCGKSSLDAVRTVVSLQSKSDEVKIAPEIIYSLPSLLRQTQHVFDQTGGLHASALFDLSGNLLLLREDVGRHNALDKLIGTSLLNSSLPLNNHILLLSGRASFELIQKAAMAGIRVVAAVGAPSSLAVEMSKEFDITLVGFLRSERFNVYSSVDRIVFRQEAKHF